MNGVDQLVSQNPFPGLRPFGEGEDDRFFGRRQQIIDLAERIEDVQFLAVAGSSGCGKSSLVRAGLLSELTRRAANGTGSQWRFAILRPGNTPIANLAENLLPVISHSGTGEPLHTGALQGRLRQGGLGLVEAVKMARLEANVRILVVVDQFEEIFRFKRMTDADEARAFIKLLLNAAEDAASPVSVVITLRSETLGCCDDFLGLPEAVSRGQYLVPKLTREQHKESITGPVELRGFTVAPRLVQRILNDVSNNFDDLPVMQHVLSRTWSRWAEACGGSRPLDLEDYQAVGTAKMALSQHADQALQSLPGLERVVEKVFRALTERVSDGVENRRPLEFDRLCRVVGADRKEVVRVVERFREPNTGFLMPPKNVALDDNPVIDISHESLIRQWQRLQDWARAEAKSRGILLRLIEAAKLHNAGEGSLLHGPDQDKALDWQQNFRPNAEWIELNTGEDGKAALESINRFLALSSFETRKARRNRIFLLWSLRISILLVIVVLVTALIGLFKNQRLTTANSLSRKALMEQRVNPYKSAQFAVDALSQNPENQQALFALRQSLASLEIAHTVDIRQFKQAVSAIRYSRDGSLLAIASGNESWVHDGMTLKPRNGPFQRDAGIIDAWVVANDTLITHTNDWQGNAHVQLQKFAEQTHRQISCEAKGDSVYSVNVSTDERYLAVGCRFGETHVLDLTNPSSETQLYRRPVNDHATVTALAFSRGSDDVYLASGYGNGLINIWKLGQSDPWIGERSDPGISQIFHDGAIRSLNFHPQRPDLLVTSSDDKLAVVWNLDLDGRRLADASKNTWILSHERPVVAARFISDQNNTVMTVSDKRVRFWNNEAGDHRQARTHQDWVNDANVSANGELLVTACSDGTAQLWSTRSAESIIVLRGHRANVTRAIFNPVRDQIVTASDDGTVRSWSINPPRLLTVSPRWLLSAVFDHAGQRVAVGEEGGCRIISLNNTEVEGTAVLQASTDNAVFQYTYLSWSHDDKILLGLKTSPDITSPPQLVLWDVETLQEITPEQLTNCRAAVFSTEGNELLSIDSDGLIGVWDTTHLTDNNYTPIKFGGPSTFRTQIASSPDGQWIASAEGTLVSLWQHGNFTDPVQTFSGHEGNITSLQFSSDSKRLLTASRDMTARIWSLGSLDPPSVLLGGHTASLNSSSFDPTGKFVVTGSADSTICVWSADSGEKLVVLRWHGESVNQVEFSPDGKSILSASDDGTVKLGQCDTFLAPGQEKLGQRLKELAIVSEEDPKRIAGENELFNWSFFFPQKK